MAITKKTTAKAKRGQNGVLKKLLKVNALRDDLHIPLVNPLPPKKQAKYGKRRAKHDRRLRLKRMHDSIFAASTFGTRPFFPGKIVIPSADDARLPDWARIQDLELLLHAGAAQVYWVDGSDSKGFLGAGIVWQVEGRYLSGPCHLGQNTGGNNADAELFAMSAALRLAKKYVQQGNQLEIVSVFSDALGILQDIKHGNCLVFGPIRKGRTALEKLHARAQWLKEREVSIEIIWVKGHSNSEGNRLADAAAGQATILQAANSPSPEPIFSNVDVPRMWRDRGQDWIDECLWRANRAHVPKSTKQQWKHKRQHAREAQTSKMESLKAQIAEKQKDSTSAL